LMSAC